MINRLGDPRTEDTIVYELLRTPRGSTAGDVAGRAIFRGGRVTVEAPESIRLAVEEQLNRAFVDRLQADERPRGYRRTGRGIVEMLVPGMAEHFIARMRGLWLSYPDGSVVTARAGIGAGAPTQPAVRSEPAEAPPVTDPAVRRATLATRDMASRPLTRSNPPQTGVRTDERPSVNRTDCGWLV
jgi:hypothetical protein